MLFENSMKYLFLCQGRNFYFWDLVNLYNVYVYICKIFVSRLKDFMFLNDKIFVNYNVNIIYLA